MCGAITYEVAGDLATFGACHCEMCRKWSGGVFLGLTAPADQVSISGQDQMTVYTSSPWAERAFCKTCGSSLFYRVTAEGPYQGDYHFGAGTLDDFSGLTFNHQLYIDVKPDAYAFAQKTKDMTRAEVQAFFGD